jgi:hypothetical protein
VAAALLLGVGVRWVTSDELFGMAAVVFGLISARFGWRDVSAHASATL